MVTLKSSDLYNVVALIMKIVCMMLFLNFILSGKSGRFHCEDFKGFKDIQHLI